MPKIAAAGVTALCASILCTTPYSFRVTPEGSVSLSPPFHWISLRRHQLAVRSLSRSFQTC